MPNTIVTNEFYTTTSLATPTYVHALVPIQVSNKIHMYARVTDSLMFNCLSVKV